MALPVHQILLSLANDTLVYNASSRPGTFADFLEISAQRLLLLPRYFSGAVPWGVGRFGGLPGLLVGLLNTLSGGIGSNRFGRVAYTIRHDTV